MLQRSLLIGTALVLLLISAVLLLADTNSEEGQVVVEETDYTSLEFAVEMTRQPAIQQTPHANTTYDNGTISVITSGQLEEIANQGIPAEHIEMDYGDAALTYPNYP